MHYDSNVVYSMLTGCSNQAIASERHHCVVRRAQVKYEATSGMLIPTLLVMCSIHLSCWKLKLLVATGRLLRSRQADNAVEQTSSQVETLCRSRHSLHGRSLKAEFLQSAVQPFSQTPSHEVGHARRLVCRAEAQYQAAPGKC